MHSGLGDEDFAQRRYPFLDDPSPQARQRSRQIVASAIAENGPFAAGSGYLERAGNRRGLNLLSLEMNRNPMITAFDIIERPAQREFAFMQHGDLVGHSLYFLEQMR